MDLQELITRGRHIFSKAPARLEVFQAVNGKRTTKDMAAKLNRHFNNVHADLTHILNNELIREKRDKDGNPVKRNRLPIYEKIPLARGVSVSLFASIAKRPPKGKIPKSPSEPATGRPRKAGTQALNLPSEQGILDICREGESQIYEFKGQGADIGKITKEIAAMLNTRQGGILFYGIQDDGTIEGTDLTRQKFDQKFQNSLRHTVSPSVVAQVHQKKVLGSTILLIIAPPWNKRDVYHYDRQVYIRKGTNVFRAEADENRKLHDGEFVV